MTISKVVEILRALWDRHGDIDCCFDCPHCGQTTPLGRVEVGAPVVKLGEVPREPGVPRS